MRVITGRACVDAELLKGAGLFIKTVADLIEVNLTEKDFEEGRPFMTNFHLSGLMAGLQMISDQLSERGEHIEEMTQAARERCQGRDTHQEDNVGAEFGTRGAD
ncbi:hypothetical protein [Pseudomonas psychrophila]|uniref:hypothetical protein n=1 Tax=Pseudomonas psychrophila TaxID=122355 RepID=UPI0002F60AB7|nr:hypothetical protein [Pseudomonas psychrophila]